MVRNEIKNLPQRNFNSGIHLCTVDERLSDVSVHSFPLEVVLEAYISPDIFKPCLLLFLLNVAFVFDGLRNETVHLPAANH
jgi:hypothetical protein